MSATTQNLDAFAAQAGLALEQYGTGRLVLMLHGGGGPDTLRSFAKTLAEQFHVVIPTHPGFNGTNRPDTLSSVKQLATLYHTMLTEIGATDVLVMGFSMGGWIASELALLKSPAVTGLILVDAVGIVVPGQTVLDVFTLPPGQLPNFSFHNPDKFRIDPATMTPERLAGVAANFAALAVYGGTMQDPDLANRLAAVTTPALIIWGESDRVATPTYGRAFADAFANGRFALIPACGHLPQVEQSAALLALVTDFTSQSTSSIQDNQLVV